ncbi:MAG: hypothetical protein NTY99_00085, partial [DPANN group archaeon]|nr:hypothetical protein [DPANN group archaeon]
RDKVFVFDYNNYANLNLVEGVKGSHLLSNPGGKPWVGIVAGDFDGGGKKDDIMAMAGSDGQGSLMLYKDVSYNNGIQSVGTTDFISKFPNVYWQNVITADINGDGKDELVTLYESDGDNEVCIFNSSGLFVLHNDDYWNSVNDNLKKLKDVTNPTCMALDGSTGFGWKSLAVGDVGCFQ